MQVVLFIPFFSSSSIIRPNFHFSLTTLFFFIKTEKIMLSTKTKYTGKNPSYIYAILLLKVSPSIEWLIALYCSSQKRKLQLLFTGNSTSKLFSWKFLKRPNGEKIRAGELVCVHVCPQGCGSYCFTGDYLCNENVRKDRILFSGCVTLCVHIVFFAFLWLFLYFICFSFAY